MKKNPFVRGKWFTEPGQKVTKQNIKYLPAGSVIRNVDRRIIHLHDDVWLMSCDHAWCYDTVERMKSYLDETSTLCHLP